MEALVKPADEPRAATRADELRAKLESMIVGGELMPGHRLDEMEISRRFGVSRTPVREAIKSLIATGLVEMRGRQGTSVTVLSIPMLVEMFELMAALEGLCASLAARRATLGQKRDLRALHEELKSALASQEPETFYDINALFHDKIYEAARTQFLGDQTIQLRRRLAPYRRQVTYQPGRMHATIGEHERIIAAIEAADAESAKRAASEHVQLLGDQLSDFIASLPDTMIARG